MTKTMQLVHETDTSYTVQLAGGGRATLSKDATPIIIRSGGSVSFVIEGPLLLVLRDE